MIKFTSCIFLLVLVSARSYSTTLFISNDQIKQGLNSSEVILKGQITSASIQNDSLVYKITILKVFKGNSKKLKISNTVEIISDNNMKLGLEYLLFLKYPSKEEKIFFDNKFLNKYLLIDRHIFKFTLEYQKLTNIDKKASLKIYSPYLFRLELDYKDVYFRKCKIDEKNNEICSKFVIGQSITEELFLQYIQGVKKLNE